MSSRGFGDNTSLTLNAKGSSVTDLKKKKKKKKRFSFLFFPWILNNFFESTDLLCLSGRTLLAIDLT